MIIERIDLRGTVKDGDKLPRAFAQISRQRGTNESHIEVHILLHNGTDLHHIVEADNHDDIWSMASCLQETLDGYAGTNSEVCDYFDVLARFAD